MGRVQSSTTITTGRNAPLSCVLNTSQAVVFAKGVPSNHKGAEMQRNEAQVGAYLKGISPTVLHHLDTGGWNILLFEYFDGRPADLAPGSADFRRLVPLLEHLLAMDAPDIPSARPVAEKWAHLTADLDLNQLSGNSLIHTDLNRGNILVGKSRAVLVDWALPGKGAPWLNLAFLICTLASEGWPPRAAERWAEQFPAWVDADDLAVDTFVEALVRRRTEQLAICPIHRRQERARQRHLCRQWLRYRRCG
ncbi:phosphotransferase family protein [Streptomyces sp. NPDC059994]|uniref:phosphotransferase family protein n=1 Tax=Streptomyces sp. NPDC059994 TaxID=3347029 RepID=UPI0036AECD22